MGYTFIKVPWTTRCVAEQMCHRHGKVTGPIVVLPKQSGQETIKMFSHHSTLRHSTHIDFKVFWCRVDAAGGGVVAWQVVQSHMGHPDWVWQRDDESALDPMESPAFPWKKNRVTLGGEGREGNSRFVWNSGNADIFTYRANAKCRTWITVRGLSDGYQRGKPKRVTHAERMRYVSEHLVLTMLAPTETHMEYRKMTNNNMIWQ